MNASSVISYAMASRVSDLLRGRVLIDVLNLPAYRERRKAARFSDPGERDPG